MPVGTEDVCHTGTTAPPDAGAPVGGGDDAGATDPDQPTAHAGGCATTGGQASLVVLLALQATRSPR